MYIHLTVQLHVHTQRFPHLLTNQAGFFRFFSKWTEESFLPSHSAISPSTRCSKKHMKARWADILKDCILTYRCMYNGLPYARLSRPLSMYEKTKVLAVRVARREAYRETCYVYIWTRTVRTSTILSEDVDTWEKNHREHDVLRELTST